MNYVNKLAVTLVVMLSFVGCGSAEEHPGLFGGGGGRVADSSGGGGGEPCEGCVDPSEIPAGQLTAGVWRDLDDWERWEGLVGDGGAFSDFATGWAMDTRGRVPVVVNDASGPVPNIAVSLVDGEGVTLWEARTDVRGEAELFAGVFEPASGPYKVHVGDVTETVELDGTRVTLDLSEAARPRRALDLMFVIDTTGSMGDELSYIQAELEDVVTRAQANAAQRFDLRLSVNVYRDEGDDYVVRSSPFSADVSTSLSFLASESPNGGGDWPEAVDAAMDDAITGHSWSEEAVARVLFLVLDAPPHQDNSEKMERLRNAIRIGAAQGVRVIPLSGTGVDENTEALLRSMAILTGGAYTFLTDHSGIGGDHLEPTVGEFEVEFLNDLMTRLIIESVDP